MKDEDINLSDCSQVTPEMFASGVVRRGLKSTPNKVQVTLRVDSDVLEWFKARGSGYQTQMNALRASIYGSTSIINAILLRSHFVNAFLIKLG